MLSVCTSVTGSKEHQYLLISTVTTLPYGHSWTMGIGVGKSKSRVRGQKNIKTHSQLLLRLDHIIAVGP